MATTNIGLPGLPQAGFLTKTGEVSSVWLEFLKAIWLRTGGAGGTPSLVLDTITSIAGSILYRGASVWTGLNPAPQFKVLRMGAQFPQWDTLDGSSFAAQGQQTFFGGPITGGAGPAAFRNYAGQLPATLTNDDAAAGNLGEYLFNSAAGVALTSGTPTDIVTLLLEPGNWIVWGNLETVPAAGTTTTAIRGWINPAASATDPGFPNAGAYALQQQNFGATLGQAMPIGSIRVKVPAGPNQTIYLSSTVTFGVSTMAASAFLGAVRPR
jgi:hypothetical protein